MRAQSIIFGLVTVLGTSLEVQAQRVLFVSQTAQGGNDGSNWENAFSDLQEALAVVEAGDEIWVAAGTYRPDRGTGDRDLAFVLVPDVDMYGGFAGWEAHREQRDWVRNETILSGDLNGDDGPRDCTQPRDCCEEQDALGCDDAACEQRICQLFRFCCDGLNPTPETWTAGCTLAASSLCCYLGAWQTCNNSRNVVYAAHVGQSALFDGFIVEGQYWDYGSPEGSFGALFCGSDSPELRNCTFRRNRQGVVRRTFPSELPGAITLTHCTFSENHGALDVGGAHTILSQCLFRRNGLAISVGYSDPGASLVIRECTFSENGPTSAIVRPGQNLQAYDCDFTDNYAKGIELDQGSSAWVERCVFRNNAIGAVWLYRSSATLVNSGIWANGITPVYANASAVALWNCELRGNTASRAVIDAYQANLSLNNITLAGNFAGGLPAAMLWLTDSQATVRNSFFWNNQTRFGDGEDAQFLLRHYDGGSSLNIQNSIVAGWTGTLGGVGNSGVDPLFVDPDGADGIIGTEDDDLRLSADSPAINAGDPEAGSYLPAFDLDGHSRILCGSVDIGAYEFGIGDFDCNRSVNLFDFASFPYCLTGPSLGVEADRSLTNILHEAFSGSKMRVRIVVSSHSRYRKRRFVPLMQNVVTGAARKQGPQSGPYETGCESFDFNADSAIDLIDLAGFQRALPAP